MVISECPTCVHCVTTLLLVYVLHVCTVSQHCYIDIFFKLENNHNFTVVIPIGMGVSQGVWEGVWEGILDGGSGEGIGISTLCSNW